MKNQEQLVAFYSEVEESYTATQLTTSRGNS